MTPDTLTRSAAIVLLAGTMLACAIEVGRLGKTSEPTVVQTRDTDDPLTRELARCKALGNDAANDAACKAAWKKSQERFLKSEKPDQGRANELFPATNNSPAPNSKQKLFFDRAPQTPLFGSGAGPNTDPEGR